MTTRFPLSLITSFIPYLKSLKLRVHRTEFEALIKNLEKIIANRHRLPHSKTDIINICKAIVAKKCKNSVLALDDFKQIEDFQKSIENCRPATKVAIATTSGWQQNTSAVQSGASVDQKTPATRTSNSLDEMLQTSHVHQPKPEPKNESSARQCFPKEEKQVKPRADVVFDLPDLPELTSERYAELESEAYRMINNIGYTVCTNNGATRILCKCFRPGCFFVLLNETSFHEHLITEHANVKWNRFCNICVGYVHWKDQTILDEFEHMKTYHIKQAISIQNPVQQSVILHPWLTDSIIKDNKAASLMLEVNALAALYKCMEISCTFFSSDPELFAEHLNYHNANGSQGHLDCAYCEFKAPENVGLVQHIQEHHKHDVYNCGSCFYRSASTINVQNHHRVCHKDISAVVIFECTPSQRLETHSIHEVLKTEQNLVRQVPPLYCAFCKDTYYGLDAYNEHLRTHPKYETTRSVCQKCKNRIHTRDLTSHFETCFNIGMHQCLYCRYGTNSENAMKVHLAHQHASTLPFFCSRSSSVQADPKSVSSLQIQYAKNDFGDSVQISKNVKELRNAKNVKFTN